MNTACQMCGKDCEINQEVKTGMTELKLWCYCKECDIETFHEIGTEKPTEKRNIMTDLEKYQRVNSCETQEELIQCILDFADEEGNIQGRTEKFISKMMADNARLYFKERASPNVITRAWGLRQQAMYLSFYAK